MSPESALREGRLDEALSLLSAQVKQTPADPKRRVFLFQLLALLGQWERAQNQLRVCGELEAQNLLLVGAYSEVLKGEATRSQVMAGECAPLVLGEPNQWLALLLQALALDARGKHGAAAPLREQAFEQAEAVTGSVDGAPFQWIADADPRFGPCLEIVVNGGYAWVPFANIKELKFEAPGDLRDKIWAPVQVTWRNQGQAIGFVPARYPGSERSDDPDLVLGRKTDWLAGEDDFCPGIGQRMLATDEAEYPLLDVRLIAFD